MEAARGVHPTVRPSWFHIVMTISAVNKIYVRRSSVLPATTPCLERLALARLLIRFIFRTAPLENLNHIFRRVQRYFAYLSPFRNSLNASELRHA
jgi:hypothetical protein